MNYEKELRAAAAFLEPARAAIDEAELKIIAAITSPRPGLLLTAACHGVAVGAKNLEWCAERIGQIAQKMMEDQASAAATVRPNAG